MTVIVEVAAIPSVLAVMVVEPVDIAVTSPPVLTLATAALLLDHVVVRPLRRLPSASLTEVVNCCVAPNHNRRRRRSHHDAVDAVPVVLAVPVTVIAAVPVLPPIAAVIDAEPGPVAVARSR